MPRQNRVTPFGDIVAVPARGTLMGNRGCLHDSAGRIRRPFRLTAWIYCVLEFKGRRRFPLMQPGQYTELFFLDEATALAAGHRPCAECQRGRYNEFMACWGKANARLLGGAKLRAPMVDAVLQRERVGARGEKVRWRAKLEELPEGTFVELDDARSPFVVMAKSLVRKWTPDGYGTNTKVFGSANVDVLTPRSAVEAIAAGFSPRLLEVH